MTGKNASLPRVFLRGGGSISSSAGLPRVAKAVPVYPDLRGAGIRRTRANLLAQIHRGPQTIVGRRVHHAPGVAVGMPPPRKASMKIWPKRIQRAGSVNDANPSVNRAGSKPRPLQISSNFQVRISNLQILIDTIPKLESDATPTKQITGIVSNRYKLGQIEFAEFFNARSHPRQIFTLGDRAWAGRQSKPPAGSTSCLRVYRRYGEAVICTGSLNSTERLPLTYSLRSRRLWLRLEISNS